MKENALRNARVILLHSPWLALLGWFSSVAWFLCDDAFISFRYVRNLLKGHGLVFNPGEYVKGYSNFLWVLELVAIWWALDVAPEDAAPWLSVAFTAGTIAAMMWWIARLPLLCHRGLVAWMTQGLVCASATFAVWTSGGGLETRQFTFFIVLAVVCLSLYRDSRRGLLVASLSLAAAALDAARRPAVGGVVLRLVRHPADGGHGASESGLAAVDLFGSALCRPGRCPFPVAILLLRRITSPQKATPSPLRPISCGDTPITANGCPTPITPSMCGRGMSRVFATCGRRRWRPGCIC